MHKAFSLIEISFTLLLISILSLLAIPAWHQYQKNHQADLVIHTLMQAIHASQTLATLVHQPVSLCPSYDQRTCQSEWRDNLLIFINPEDRDQPSELRAIHEHFPFKLYHGSLQWRHFSAKKTLNFTSNGLLAYDNSLFYYCPLDPNFSRALVINALGRIRLLTTRNTQGQLLDPDGQPIRCLS